MKRWLSSWSTSETSTSSSPAGPTPCTGPSEARGEMNKITPAACQTDEKLDIGADDLSILLERTEGGLQESTWPHTPCRTRRTSTSSRVFQGLQPLHSWFGRGGSGEPLPK